MDLGVARRGYPNFPRSNPHELGPKGEKSEPQASTAENGSCDESWLQPNSWISWEFLGEVHQGFGVLIHSRVCESHGHTGYVDKAAAAVQSQLI